jgi:hypothetical protein
MEKPTQDVVNLINAEEGQSDADVEYILIPSENEQPTTNFHSIMPIENANKLSNIQIVSAVSLNENHNGLQLADNWPKIQQVFARSADPSSFQFELCNANDTPKDDIDNAASLFLQSDSNNLFMAQHSDASQSSNSRTDDNFRAITEDNFRAITEESDQSDNEEELEDASLSARNTPQLQVTDEENTPVKRQEQALSKEQEDKRDNRRKSHHVVRANCESPTFEFREEPVPKLPENQNPNDLLMKKLAFLRTATNFLLKETGRKPFQFKHNIDNLSFVDVFREIEQNKY